MRDGHSNDFYIICSDLPLVMPGHVRSHGRREKKQRQRVTRVRDGNDHLFPKRPSSICRVRVDVLPLSNLIILHITTLAASGSNCPSQKCPTIWFSTMTSSSSTQAPPLDLGSCAPPERPKHSIYSQTAPLAKSIQTLPPVGNQSSTYTQHPTPASYFNSNMPMLYQQPKTQYGSYGFPSDPFSYSMVPKLPASNVYSQMQLLLQQQQHHPQQQQQQSLHPQTAAPSAVPISAQQEPLSNHLGPATQPSNPLALTHSVNSLDGPVHNGHGSNYVAQKPLPHLQPLAQQISNAIGHLLSENGTKTEAPNGHSTAPGATTAITAATTAATTASTGPAYQKGFIQDVKTTKSFHQEKTAKAEEPDTASAAKPFACEHDGCSWSFARQSDLRRHAKSHKEPAFHCPFWRLDPTCHRSGGGFSRLDVLKRHLRLVHYVKDKQQVYPGQDPGWCRACQKMFSSSKQFIDHAIECAELISPAEWRAKGEKKE